LYPSGKLLKMLDLCEGKVMEKWGVKLRDANKKVICRGSPLEVYIYMCNRDASLPFIVLERIINRLKEASFLNIAPDMIEWEGETVVRCNPKILKMIQDYVAEDPRALVFSARDLHHDIEYYPIGVKVQSEKSEDCISLGNNYDGNANKTRATLSA
jgi:hypothetical protein